MNLLVLWLGTSISSFCVEISNELRMYKDIADAGYKINIERMSELGDQINPDGLKILFLTMLIPIYNITQAFKSVIEYNNIRPMLLDKLRIMNVIEEMTEIEKEEYLKRPTGLNAIIIPFKSEVRLLTADSVIINDGLGESEIFYEMGESLDDITILKVDGPASLLTIDEQKKKILDTCNNFHSLEIEKSQLLESSFNELNDYTKLELNHSFEEKNEELSTKQDLSFSKKKQELENIKNELLKEQQMIENSNDKREANLTKKRIK